MRSPDRPAGTPSPSLALALNLEWDDLGPERAALAAVGAEVVRPGELNESELPRVVALLSEGARVTGDDLRGYPSLKVVSEFGTGYDGIDVEAATELGVAVTNVAGYCTEEVADHTLALALFLLRRLGPLAAHARRGQWMQVVKGTVRSGSNLTWGVIGFGRIGKAVARRARAFGFSVCAFDPQVDSHEMSRDGARALDLDELLAQSDVATIHSARTGQDDHMLDRRRLALMKSTAYLVNVARGAFIDEEALADALDAGRLAGAALDVMTDEPPDPSSRLLRHARTLITPHVAWYSDRAEAELRQRGLRAVVDVLAGRQPADLVPELRPPS